MIINNFTLTLLDGHRFGRVRFNVPPNTLEVISGAGFYTSNDPTNSVKALKDIGNMTGRVAGLE